MHLLHHQQPGRLHVLAEVDLAEAALADLLQPSEARAVVRHRHWLGCRRDRRPVRRQQCRLGLATALVVALRPTAVAATAATAHTAAAPTAAPMRPRPALWLLTVPNIKRDMATVAVGFHFVACGGLGFCCGPWRHGGIGGSSDDVTSFIGRRCGCRIEAILLPEEGEAGLLCVRRGGGDRTSKAASWNLAWSVRLCSRRLSHHHPHQNARFASALALVARWTPSARAPALTASTAERSTCDSANFRALHGAPHACKKGCTDWMEPPARMRPVLWVVSHARRAKCTIHAFDGC